MNDNMPSKRRLVTVAVIAAAILLAIVLLTGNQTLSSPSGAGDITVLPPTTAPSVATVPPSGSVAGVVTVSVKHLSGQTWQFSYTVRVTGKTPVAGFQLTGPTAHLFNIIGPGWNYYGTGVCGKSGPQGLLIYWSTNQAATDLVRPGKSATFGFDVNTSGSAPLSYSISYGAATPQFGQTRGPASSTLPASGPCK